MTRLIALLALAASSACVSFFPPHALDIGRGAEPLKLGTLQAHGGVGGGAAPFALAMGAGGGAGVEGQVTDDLAVGFDLGTGVQGAALGATTIPSAAYLTLQYNPAGMKNLAVRAAGGIGEDIIGIVGVPLAVSPWGAATGGIVTSTKLGSIDAYLALDGGARRFIGGPDNKVIQLTEGTNITNTMYAAGATVGANIPLTDDLGVYLSGNVTGLMLLADEGEGVAKNLQPLFVPTANGQVGITYKFDAPN